MSEEKKNVIKNTDTIAEKVEDVVEITEKDLDYVSGGANILPESDGTCY